MDITKTIVIYSLLCSAVSAAGQDFIQAGQHVMASSEAQEFRIQGSAVALSADGSVLAVGGTEDGNTTGTVWLFHRSLDGSWAEIGARLSTHDSSKENHQFRGLSLSADGNILAVGDGLAGNETGTTYIYERPSMDEPMIKTATLVGTNGEMALQGRSVALSADGTVVAVGGSNDDDFTGATWIFAKSPSGEWSQQGQKLVGTNGAHHWQGWSVDLSANGGVLAVGGPSVIGAELGGVWMFVRSEVTGEYTQQGEKLVDIGSLSKSIPLSLQGQSVSLSADGNVLAYGGPGVDLLAGAAWVYKREGTGDWIQVGDKLVGSGGFGFMRQGHSVDLAADGKRLVVGGWNDESGTGATWVFDRTASGEIVQLGDKLVGTGDEGQQGQGWIVAVSSDGCTIAVGAPWAFDTVGATWVFLSECVDPFWGKSEESITSQLLSLSSDWPQSSSSGESHSSAHVDKVLVLVLPGIIIGSLIFLAGIGLYTWRKKKSCPEAVHLPSNSVVTDDPFPDASQGIRDDNIPVDIPPGDHDSPIYPDQMPEC